MTTYYIVQDTPSEGADFFVWGINCPDEAQRELQHCEEQGIGPVQLIVTTREEMDERTRQRIFGADSDPFPAARKA